MTTEQRQQLIGDFAKRIVEGMDFEQLVTYATDRLVDAYNILEDEALLAEVSDLCPDLLEN